MSQCWILVANSWRATLYMSDPKLTRLDEVRTLTHPESRLKNREINTDAHGRNVNAGTSTGHNYSSEQDPHDHEAEVFAKELAQALRLARNDGSFDSLILVAPPKFLGHLRQHLDADTGRMVSESIAHDWTAQNAREVGASIRGALAK